MITTLKKIEALCEDAGRPARHSRRSRLACGWHRLWSLAIRQLPHRWSE